MSGKSSAVIDVFRIFLREQERGVEESKELLKVLSGIGGGVSEASRGLRAAKRFQIACILLLEKVHIWEARRISIMLAAIDQFGQTIVWTLSALDHMNRAQFARYRNASVVSIYQAELLFLHAEEYEKLTQVDSHCHQADTLYRFLGESSELLDSSAGRHYEDIKGINSYVCEKIDQLHLHTADSEDHNVCSSMPEVHAGAVYWTEMYGLHCTLSQLMEPLYGPHRLVGGGMNMALLEMSKTASKVAKWFTSALKFQKIANAARHRQLRLIYELTRDLALAIAHRYAARYNEESAGDSDDIGNKEECCQALLQRAVEMRTWLDWQQPLQDALEHTADHRSALETTIEEVTQRLNEAEECIVSSALATGQEGWKDASEHVQSRLHLLTPILRVENFYMAQYYTDQHTATVQQQDQSQYHFKLAEYWGGANSAMKAYLTESLAGLQFTEVVTAEGVSLRVWDQREGFDSLTRALQYERYAVSMCEGRHHLPLQCAAHRAAPAGEPGPPQQRQEQ